MIRTSRRLLYPLILVTVVVYIVLGASASGYQVPIPTAVAGRDAQDTSAVSTNSIQYHLPVLALNSNVGGEPQLVRGPYLGNVQPDSMTII